MWRLPTAERFRSQIDPKRFAILEACIIGLVSGLAAVLLQDGIGWLGSWRIRLATEFPALIALPLIGLIGGLIAGWLIENFASDAAGSGIPQVKAALAQFPVALDLQVAFVKLLSGIATLGAGLSLGRQGPTVQIGAALASQLSYWFPTAPDHRRQMIAAGAGAGLAAGFNAPIAGVLFIVEELLHDLSGLTLGTAILSSFIGAVVARVLGGQSWFLNLDQVVSDTTFSVPEIPFYIILGALAGVLGAFFNRSLMASMNFNRRISRLGMPLRIGLAGCLCGLVISQLPTIFQDNTGLRGLLGGGTLGWQMAAIAFIVQFALTLVAYGSGAPGGLFAPSLILGAALGHLVGLSHASIFGTEVTTTYALVGMGAFFGAVSRVPVTGIVIIFEITTDFNLVLPLMISSVVANLAAEAISQGSVYDLLLERQGIQLQADASEKSRSMLDTLTAADIMERRVETLPQTLPLDQALTLFANSHHRGFPIVSETGLVGIVTRTDLNVWQQQNLDATTTLQDVMTPHPLVVNPKATLNEVLYWLNRSNISRLPVTEGRKLVGIITRADIIRAESEQITGEQYHQGTSGQPSYQVYRTRGPATGRGRLLVALSNPETADLLLRLAIAIARERDYELECVRIIVVARNCLPSETPVRTSQAQRLLRRAVRYGQRAQISVHTQIRVAHDVAQTILEIEKQRHIDLILMGWQGKPTTGQVINRSVQTVLRKAVSNVLVVKSPHGQGAKQWDRWLVPISSGPNIQQAIQLLPALTAHSPNSDIRLCQIYTPTDALPHTSLINRYVDFLDHRLSGNVLGTQICAQNVAEAIVDLANRQQFDVIVLGASQVHLWKQVLMGSIPDAIATTTDRAVILVRGRGTTAVS